jgi:SNF2 family DNA or RNA helicase
MLPLYTEQLAHLPEYPMPELLDTVHLYDHQIAGIRWLIHQEQETIPSYFSENVSARGRKTWKCAITTSTQTQMPKAVRGGIMADDMVSILDVAVLRSRLSRYMRPTYAFIRATQSQGLGKTLQCIGLILSRPPTGFESYPLPSNYAYLPRKEPRCTLIVCPKSVAANWIMEINKHVNRRTPNKYLVVDKYFGKSSDCAVTAFLLRARFLTYCCSLC